MADIFISYAREDREWVEKLAATLQAEGFSVWWDWDLLVGKRYRETIETELQTCKATIVVWSEQSVRSDFVRDEAEEGQQRNLLLPVLKGNVRPPAGFRQIQTADLTNWAGDRSNEEFRRMMRGVSHLVGRQANLPDGVTPAAEPAPVTAAQTAAKASAPPPPPPSKPAVAPVSFPKPTTSGAPAFAFTPPAGLADLATKVPAANNPIWRYVAFGVVGVLALGFIVSQFTGTSPTPPKPHPLLAEDANGDVAGNPHGSKPMPDNSGNAGDTGNGDATGNGGGDEGQGGQTGGGSDTGQDVGQSH
jgi:hypothetical protein